MPLGTSKPCRLPASPESDRTEIGRSLLNATLKDLGIEKGDSNVRYAYPCQINRHEGDEFVVSFPDVEGANTSGSDRVEALEMAADALSAALGMYVDLHLAIPVPSAVLDGQEAVAVDPVTAAKLELYTAMRDQGVTERALAKRLGLSDTTAGRLTDPDHRSHIGLVSKALRSVGRGLVIEGRAGPGRVPSSVLGSKA